MLKSEKKIGIIGFGYVGKAMFSFFKDHYETVAYDINPVPICKKIDSSDKEVFADYMASKEEIKKCDVAVICLPTQPLVNGRCDTSLIEDAVDWIESPLIIIKSTVEPETTDRLKKKTGKRICFSPEFLGESSYWTPYKFHTDAKETPFFIFGGDRETTSECVSLYLPITGPTKSYRQTTALEAEMAKYIENTFYATKIAYCYDMATLCEHIGADWNEVRELFFKLDPRVSDMHSAVFVDNDKPFGKKCLPKDILALSSYAESKGYRPEILFEVIKSNDRIGAYRKTKRESKGIK